MRKLGNLQRENEFLLIAPQYNAIITNDIKARIDKTQENSKCLLCGDRDETINHIISEFGSWSIKLHDSMGRLNHWKLRKKFKFDHMNKWYMNNPASVLENETHELRWDFDIQTDHLTSDIRIELIIIIKKGTFKI